MIRSHIFVTLMALAIASCASGPDRPRKPCTTITWECDDDSVVMFEVELLGEIHAVTDKEFNIEALPSGAYTARIRSISRSGRRSEWIIYSFRK